MEKSRNQYFQEEDPMVACPVVSDLRDEPEREKAPILDASRRVPVSFI